MKKLLKIPRKIEAKFCWQEKPDYGYEKTERTTDSNENNDYKDLENKYSTPQKSSEEIASNNEDKAVLEEIKRKLEKTPDGLAEAGNKFKNSPDNINKIDPSLSFKEAAVNGPAELLASLENPTSEEDSERLSSLGLTNMAIDYYDAA